MARALRVKAAISTAGLLAGGVIDFLFPPVCAVCDAPVGEAHSLCASCWRKLEFITAPMCPVMGLPFAVEMGPGALSAEAPLQQPCLRLGC